MVMVHRLPKFIGWTDEASGECAKGTFVSPLRELAFMGSGHQNLASRAWLCVHTKSFQLTITCGGFL